MNIGVKILKLRKKFDLTQEELANDLNISKTTLRKWESDNCLPNLENIKNLSLFFNVPIAFWFDEKMPNPTDVAITKQLKALLKHGKLLIEHLENVNKSDIIK